MAGYLTTHVLDLGLGQPAEGLSITLWRIDGADRTRVTCSVTNADGRTDVPILAEDAFAAGIYELVFDAGSYLGARSDFLGDVPLRFTMGAPIHYHVPLLLSPFGYSTYRGS